MAKSTFIILSCLLVAISSVALVSGLLGDDYEDPEEPMQPTAGAGKDTDHDYHHDDEDNGEDAAKDQTDGKLKLQIFYQAECPESRRFFAEELQQTVQLMGDHIYVDMVPFGFSNLTKDGVLKCQFGPRECASNRRHACIIERTKAHKHQLAQIQTISCLMNWKPKEKCYKNHLPKGISADEIEKCASSQESMQLMKKYKDKTPKQINHLPYLAIEGNYERGQYESCKGSSQFRECICDKLGDAGPRMCGQHYVSK